MPRREIPSRSAEWVFTVMQNWFRSCPFVSSVDELGLECDPKVINIEWPPDVKYFSGQIEKAPTTGTLHVQGYVEFTTEKKFSDMRKPSVLFGKDADKNNYRAAVASREKNVKYTGKSNTRVTEGLTYEKEGTRDETQHKEERAKRARATTPHEGGAQEERSSPPTQKPPTAAEMVRRAALKLLNECCATMFSTQEMHTYLMDKITDENVDDSEKSVCMKANMILMQSIKFYDERVNSVEKRGANILTIRKVTCEVLFGDPGTGKTYGTLSAYGRKVYTKDKTKWWNCYNPQLHSVVLLDEFNGEPIGSHGYWTTDTLQKVLQGYEMLIETKGGYTRANWNHVVITTNLTFDMWFDSWKGIPLIIQQSIKSRITKFTELRGQSRRIQNEADIPAPQHVTITEATFKN